MLDGKKLYRVALDVPGYAFVVAGDSERDYDSAMQTALKDWRVG